MSDAELTEPRVRLAEAARLLGIATRTAKRWIRSGRLRAFKPGRCVVVLRSDVTALLEESEVQPARPRPERTDTRRQQWRRRSLKGLE